MSNNLCDHCGKQLFQGDMLEDKDGGRYHIGCFAEMAVQDIFGIDLAECDKAAAVKDMIEADLMEEALARPYRKYNTAHEAFNA